MDIVLGVSMTPSAVRMVLVEGENADGVSLDHNAVNITPVAESAMSGAPQQVLDAILGTGTAPPRVATASRPSAWPGPTADAAQLRQSLRRHRLEDVILVSELRRQRAGPGDRPDGRLPAHRVALHRKRDRHRGRRPNR